MRLLAGWACIVWYRVIEVGQSLWRKALQWIDVMSQKPSFITYFAILLLFLNTEVSAQELIKASQSAWLALTSSERESIQKKYIVELAEPDTFGIIIDNQGVNESSGGTTGGANLGSAIANAAYIDNAIEGDDYSVKNQLAAGILGAMLGSTLDSKSIAQYHYRYAIKLASGDVKYFDEIKGDQFRHPTGICISVPGLTLVEQQLCTQTAELLRTRYLDTPTAQVVKDVPVVTTTIFEKAPAQKITQEIGSSSSLVNCKLGTLVPVRTSAEKCELIKGSQVQ